MWRDPRRGRWDRRNTYIARAAASLGATLEEASSSVHDDALVVLSKGERRVLLAGTRGPGLTVTAEALARDKLASGQALAQAGLPVIERVPIHDPEEPGQAGAAEAALSRWGRVVAKPAHGDDGRWVAPNLRTWPHLRDALMLCRDRDPRGLALIEPQLPWVELQITLVGQAVYAASFLRTRLVGDGQTPIRGLIARANEDVQRGDARRGALTPLDLLVPELGWTEVIALEDRSLDTVLPHGSTLPVPTDVAAITDVTDEVAPRWVQVAREACRVLGLGVASVHLLVGAIQREDEGVILEVDPCPALERHARPTSGRSRQAFEQLVALALRDGASTDGLPPR